MNLEENEHILENKELKTNSQKRRFITINNTTDKHFENGIVTIIHQEQFNQLKEEYNNLKANDENPITEHDLQQLQEQIQQLEEEKQELKNNNETLEKELEETSFKLDLALKNETVEQINLQNDKRINDLKEILEEKEEKIKSYKDEVSEKEDENKSLSIALTNIITKYEGLISDYESIKNRNFLERIMNSNTKEIAVEEVSDYKKLVENKPVYTIETKLDE